MRTRLSILFLILFTSVVQGQSIRYEKNLSDALAKASAQNKLVFMVVNIPPSPNHIIKYGLDAPEVATRYNENFINYKVLVTDTAFTKLRRKYPANILPAYFFLDKSGNIIYRDAKNFSISQKYFAMADSALRLSKSGNTLSDLEVRYRSGNIDGPMLKEYITLREKMGIYDNGKLIDQYVDFLTIGSLNNYQDVLFILKAGPFVYGKAYMLAYTNKKVADSVYKTEPAADRSAMNGRMMTNTYMQAVATKDLRMAQQLSSFITNIYSRTNYRAGTREASRYMLYYYTAVKDTGNYLRQAMYYYDNYYMNISADSAKRMEEKSRQAFIKSQQGTGKTISKDSLERAVAQGKLITTQVSFSTINSVQDVSGILNNAAYSFYTTGTRNQAYLIKAIAWSRRSIDLKPLSGYYDTLAHLLYRYGFYSEAEQDQNLAIEMAKKEEIAQKAVYEEHLKTELVKIKKRTL